MVKTATPRRFKDVDALRRAVRQRALALWNDGKRPTWDSTLTPVDITGALAPSPAMGKRLAKLPLGSRHMWGKDEIEQDACDRAMAEVPALLKAWLPVAKDTLDVVSRQNGARLRDLVEIVEAIPVRESQKMRRQVFDYVRTLLAPRRPTAQELAWASLLCGAEVEVDPKSGTLVSEVIVKETKDMRHYVK